MWHYHYTIRLFQGEAAPRKDKSICFNLSEQISICLCRKSGRLLPHSTNIPKEQEFENMVYIMQPIVISFFLLPSRNSHQEHSHMLWEHLHTLPQCRNRPSEVLCISNSFQRHSSHWPTKPSRCSCGNASDDIHEVTLDDTEKESAKADHSPKSCTKSQEETSEEADDLQKGLGYHWFHIRKLVYCKTWWCLYPCIYVALKGDSFPRCISILCPHRPLSLAGILPASLPHRIVRTVRSVCIRSPQDFS